jgi:hypothetical protein
MRTLSKLSCGLIPAGAPLRLRPRQLRQSKYLPSSGSARHALVKRQQQREPRCT